MASSAIPTPNLEGSGSFNSPLYAGNTTVTGMPTPVGSGVRQAYMGSTTATSSTAAPQSTGTRSTFSNPSRLPITAYGSSNMPATGFVPATAPNMLTVTQNPGTTSTGTSAGTSGASTPGTATGGLAGLTSTEASRVLGENQNYLGQGMGSLATEYLQSGAGYNGALAQQTVSATDAAMQQQINQQYGALQSSMAEAGLSPDSSGFTLGESSFLSNASAQENEVAANQYTQMYSQAQQDYLSELEQLQGYNFEGTMNQQTVLGDIGSLLTGGVGGLMQYMGGAAGTAGTVSSTGGILGTGGLSTVAGDLF